MHDTAFNIGSLAMNIYSDLTKDSILEVGSQAVNGSLREHALPTTRYVGLDIEEGEGVDIVVEPGKSYPLEDNSFDLVIASSVFEHDPFFWLTFLEMCRITREGGYIYINAPSNGAVHRYPQDNWRFYPDSGKALAQWAVSQGSAVTLVESFIAKREADIWNDFVAVFRKGRITKTLPKVFIHENVPCTDVITWKSKEVMNPSFHTEDGILLTELGERACLAEDRLKQAVNERDAFEREGLDLKVKLAAAEDERQRSMAEASRLAGELNTHQSELRQRQEEIEQTRTELSQARARLEQSRRELSAAHAQIRDSELEHQALLRAQQELNATIVAQLREREAALAQHKLSSESVEKQLKNAGGDLERAKEALRKSEQRIDELASSLQAAQAARSEVERRLSAHFQETAKLSSILLEAERSTERAADKGRRLQEFYHAAVSQPRWWSVLPRSGQARLQRRRLQRLGLFDGQSYLNINPDVAESGMDPLEHYIRHGIDEGRKFESGR